MVEVGFQDYWQRSQLALAAVCHNSNGAHSLIDQIINYIEEDVRFNIISRQVEIY